MTARGRPTRVTPAPAGVASEPGWRDLSSPLSGRRVSLEPLSIDIEDACRLRSA